MNKKLKTALIFITSLLLLVYLSFLFILPDVLSFETLKPQITTEIQKITGLKSDIKTGKIKTLWNLKAEIILTGIKLNYPDNTEFLSVKNLEVQTELLPLIFKKVIINNISITKPEIYLERKLNGDYKFSYLIKKQPENNQKNPEIFVFKDTKIQIKDYSLKFNDNYKSNKNIYLIKGDKLNIQNFNQGKNIKFETIGNVTANNKSLVNYNLKINTDIPKTGKNSSINLTPFEKLVKYNFTSNLVADLNIKNNLKTPEISGNAKIDKISFKIGAYKFPESNIYLKFNGNKVSVNSTIYTHLKEKILITGDLTPFELNYFNLRVKTGGLSLSNLYKTFFVFSGVTGINVDKFKNIDINGLFISDFNVYSNLKKFDFKGTAGFKNINISSGKFKSKLQNMNIDVNSDNGIFQITKGFGYLDKIPVTISGTIDKNTNTFINIQAPKIPAVSLFSLINAAPDNIKILGGNIAINAGLKGKFKQPEKDVNLKISDITVKYKPFAYPIKFSQGEILLSGIDAELKILLFNCGKVL